MNANAIQRVLIVGAGTMGRQIGLQCALFGLDVTLHDIEQDALDAAERGLADLAAWLAGEGYIDAERGAEVLRHIEMTTDLARAAATADIVSESIPESPELKRRVWSELDRLLPREAIRTTNTSTLLPSEIAPALAHPERFLAWHFHLPAFTANVVDVMPTGQTEPAIVDAVMDLSRRIGQIPIRIEKEHPGYVFNTMLVAWLGAARDLAIDGVARHQDIDRAWMGITKMPHGPFAIMDMIGLDTVLHVLRAALEKQPEDENLRRGVAWLGEWVGRGDVGMKAGKGFYSYPHPEFERPGFLEGKGPEEERWRDLRREPPPAGEGAEAPPGMG